VVDVLYRIQVNAAWQREKARADVRPTDLAAAQQLQLCLCKRPAAFRSDLKQWAKKWNNQSSLVEAAAKQSSETFLFVEPFFHREHTRLGRNPPFDVPNVIREQYIRP
jgi:hypothetical protein